MDSVEAAEKYWFRKVECFEKEIAAYQLRSMHDQGNPDAKKEYLLPAESAEQRQMSLDNEIRTLKARFYGHHPSGNLDRWKSR